MEENNEPTRLQWYQFYAKYTVMAISAVWVLIAGTDFLDKQTKELKLKNEKLSKNSIPLAFHTMDVKTDNEPWNADPDLCTITGSYAIENIGELPFLIEEVTFSIYEFKILDTADVAGNDVTSFTLFKRLENKSPLFQETLKVDERVGVKGQLEKSLGYIVKKRPNHNYVVVAEAKGGLTDTDGNLDKSYMFGENELTHTVGPVNICVAPKTK